MFERLRERFRRPQGTEDDVAPDRSLAGSRATGGGDHDDGDSGSTTGTGGSEEFVGRVSGQDEGDVGESGAERRSEALRTDPGRTDPGRTGPGRTDTGPA